MNEILTFEDFWQGHEDQVLLIADNDFEKALAIKMLCHNAWLQSDLVRGRSLLSMAQTFESERKQSSEILSSVNTMLDGLINIAQKLEKKGDHKLSDNDGG